jgi:prolyl-tRNA synthetase
MIKQASAGIYSWLPLGFKVLQKIEQIVHEEQARAGHLAMLMPTIQSADLWRESGRYDAYGAEMLRIKDRHDRDMLFTPTAEELITDIFRAHVTSYKDLPLTMYQIQWKFRDEIRPRFGVMRGREFYMKDGYNFDLTKEDALHSYNRHLVSYLRTYERMGLQAIPMRADSGPIGGDDTHEFLVLAETGESEVFYDSEITDLRFGDRDIDYDSHAACQAVLEEFTSRYARTDETHDPGGLRADPRGPPEGCAGDRGGPDLLFRDQVFRGDGRLVTDHDGNRVPVHMGSHGIGVSRLVGAIIEACHDENGIIWPEGVTPFHVGIVNLKQGDASCDTACEDLLQGADRGGAGAALRRPRGTGRREVRHHGPDRPALADHGGAARPCEWQGGTDLPQDRRERGDLAGGRGGAGQRDLRRLSGHLDGLLCAPVCPRSDRRPARASRP